MDFRIFKYILAIFLVAVGVVIGIAVRHYHDIPLVETLNVVDIATLVTTIFLAVYIPEVLDRKLQVKRDKKELIEKRLEEFQAFYRRINIIVQQDHITKKDYLTIKHTLDVCKHRFNTIEILLGYSNLKVSFPEEIKMIKKLCSEHNIMLWSDKMEDDDFGYPDNIQTKEEILYNKIDEKICLLVFKISEA